MKSRNPVLEFDKLQMYFGEPYVIDVEDALGSITVYEPTIGDIIRIGEKRFYSNLNIFVTNTTSYRLQLWEGGIDWNEIKDFELFILLIKNIDNEVSKLMFRDLDFSKFELIQKTDGSITLVDVENGIEINENVYHHICQYLRNVFNIFPEEKITKNKIMKEWFIQKDKRAQEVDKKKTESGIKKDNSIQSIISTCVNHAGFKYKLSELRNVGVCEFYDSVKRIQVYENTTALLKGMYSGFVDSSKINPDAYNFMKEI